MSSPLLPEDKNILPCTGVGGEGVNICQTQALVGSFTLFLHCNYKMSLNGNHLRLMSGMRIACITFTLTYILACTCCLFELTGMCDRFLPALISMHNNEAGARKQLHSNCAIKQSHVPNSSPPGLRLFQK